MFNTKKSLATLTIAGMLVTMIPFNAMASSAFPTSLAGTTAAETAVAIANQTGWTGTAILASSTSYGMVDALTAGPLATFLKAPILLQGAGKTLNEYTKAELSKLSVKTVYVASGPVVIDPAVLTELTSMGIDVKTLGGVDQFETSVNMATEMIKLGAPVSKVAVAYGWLNQDALSIASIASAQTQPIILTEKDSVPPSVKDFLTANKSVSTTDVIGGTGVISDAVKESFPKATRHSGLTAYDTNNQVIQDFTPSLNFNNVFVANGVTGIDALAGAPLAAQTNSPIVLTDGTVPAAATFVNSKLFTTSVVTALGGNFVVPPSVLVGIAYHALAVASVSAVNNGANDRVTVTFNKNVEQMTSAQLEDLYTSLRAQSALTRTVNNVLDTTALVPDKMSTTLSGNTLSFNVSPVVKSDTVAKTVQYSVTMGLQSVKDATGFVVPVDNQLSVNSVSAINSGANDKVTVTFNQNVEQMTSAQLEYLYTCLRAQSSLTRTVDNAVDTTALVPDKMSITFSGSTLTFNVSPTVTSGPVAKTVVYSVTMGTHTVKAVTGFVVAAK